MPALGTPTDAGTATHEEPNSGRSVDSLQPGTSVLAAAPGPAVASVPQVTQRARLDAPTDEAPHSVAAPTVKQADAAIRPATDVARVNADEALHAGAKPARAGGRSHLQGRRSSQRSSIFRSSLARRGDVVLPEMVRLGGDKYFQDVISNMRSAGRLLLANPVVQPSFERVSIVLSTSSDPAKLIVLDCVDEPRPAAERRAFAKAVVRQMMPNGTGLRSTKRPLLTPRTAEDGSGQPASRQGTDTDSTVTHGRSHGGTQSGDDEPEAGSDTQQKNMAHAGKDGGNGTMVGDGGADVGGRNSAASRAPSTLAKVFAPASAEQLQDILSSPSLAMSLNNSGRAESDSSRPKRVLTKVMQARFLTATGLPDLRKLSFAVAVDVWQEAQGLKESIASMAGKRRDWGKLYPVELWDNNWTLPAASGDDSVADRTCLHPPRSPRVKCTRMSRAIALAVAFSLSPFWNLAVVRHFSNRPYVASPAASESDDGISSDVEEPVGDGVPPDPVEKPPDVPSEGGGGPRLPAAAVGKGPADQAPVQGRTAVSIALSLRKSAAQAPGVQNVSAADVLILGRRGPPPASAGDAAECSPAKVRKTDNLGTPPSLDVPPTAALTSLVGRTMLKASVTAAPPKRTDGPPEPPTPPRAKRVLQASESFSLASVVAVGRALTTAQLVATWKAVPSVSSEKGVDVVKATMNEWPRLRGKTHASFLLSEVELKAAFQKRNALGSELRDVRGSPALDQLAIEVSVGGELHRLPFAVVLMMTEVHRFNHDYRTSGQSSEWIKGIGGATDVVVDPVCDDFLLPTRVPVATMIRTVRDAVGRSKPGEDVWERTLETVVNRRTGEPVDVVTSWALSARNVVDAARHVWRRCSFVDPVLVELAQFARSTGISTHILTCEKLTSMMTTAQGRTVDLAHATRLARRWAVGAQRSSSFATMVNHDNSHWCAAFVSLVDREIVFYDPLGPVTADSKTEFSMARLRILGDAIISEQGGSGGTGAARAAWKMSRVGLPRQTDSVSCGLFSLQFIIQRVTGGRFELDGEEADILRLVLVHKMIVAGRTARAERAAAT